MHCVQKKITCFSAAHRNISQCEWKL